MFPRMSVSLEHRNVKWAASPLMPRVGEQPDIFTFQSALNRLDGEVGHLLFRLLGFISHIASTTEAGLLDISTLLKPARLSHETIHQLFQTELLARSEPNRKLNLVTNHNMAPSNQRYERVGLLRDVVRATPLGTQHHHSLHCLFPFLSSSS